MTPERRQFVTTLISKIGSSLCCDQPDSIALAELGTAMCDLVEDYDSITAENDRLKGEVEQAKHDFDMQNQAMNYITQDWRREFGLVHEYLHKYGIGLGGEKIIELLVADAESLRTRLDALVKAANAIVPEVYALTRQVIAYQTQSIEKREERFERATTKMKADALAAAVEQAKGVK